MKFKSLIHFMKTFDTEEKCINYFELVRWPNGVTCPHCGHDHIYRYKNRRYRCAECQRDFRIKTGTIFGESKVPLRKWFIAIYLILSSKKGISSIQLSDHLGVTQKTAWSMGHRIRRATKQDKSMLFGEIEVDETYVGGKSRNKHASARIKGASGRSTENKTVLFGMLQRSGDVKANIIPNVKSETLQDQILEYVDRSSSLYTDDFRGYREVGKLYDHVRIGHSYKRYTEGKAHTNSIEGFWAYFKRSYYGVYHHMSPKYMQKYVDSLAYRFNRRNEINGDIFTDLVRRMSEGEYAPIAELSKAK